MLASWHRRLARVPRNIKLKHGNVEISRRKEIWPEIEMAWRRRRLFLSRPYQLSERRE